MKLIVKFNLFLYFTLFLLFCIDSATSFGYKSIRGEHEIDLSSELLENDLMDDDDDYNKYELLDDQSDERSDLEMNRATNKEQNVSTGELNGNEIDGKRPNAKKMSNRSNGEVTESPINTLIAITRAPIQLVHTILTGNETSKHAKEISDIIGYNLKKIVKKFFKIANDMLDNFNTINNAGLVSAIVQIASFMTKVNQFVNPTEWQTLMKLNLPNNIRLPLNLRSPNADHEQFFDDVNDLL